MGTTWMILPMEICEIIFKHWIVLILNMLKFFSSLSDADLYSELRKRNQFCLILRNIDILNLCEKYGRNWFIRCCWI